MPQLPLAATSDSGVPGIVSSSVRAFSPLFLLSSISLYFLTFPSTGSTSCTSLLLQLHCTLTGVRLLGAHSFAASRSRRTRTRSFRRKSASTDSSMAAPVYNIQVQVNPTQTIALVRPYPSSLGKPALVALVEEGKIGWVLRRPIACSGSHSNRPPTTWSRMSCSNT